MMLERYDYSKMMEEIGKDEEAQESSGHKVTQDDIRKMIEDKKDEGSEK